MGRMGGTLLHDHAVQWHSNGALIFSSIGPSASRGGHLQSFPGLLFRTALHKSEGGTDTGRPDAVTVAPTVSSLGRQLRETVEQATHMQLTTCRSNVRRHRTD